MQQELQNDITKDSFTILQLNDTAMKYCATSLKDSSILSQDILVLYTPGRKQTTGRIRVFVGWMNISSAKVCKLANSRSNTYCKYLLI